MNLFLLISPSQSIVCIICSSAFALYLLITITMIKLQFTLLIDALMFYALLVTDPHTFHCMSYITASLYTLCDSYSIMLYCHAAICSYNVLLKLYFILSPHIMKECDYSFISLMLSY